MRLKFAFEVVPSNNPYGTYRWPSPDIMYQVWPELERNEKIPTIRLCYTPDDHCKRILL